MTENINEKVKAVIGDATKEGITVDLVGNYLKLTNVPVGAHKDIMDGLYQKHGVYPWDLAFLREVDLIIEEVKNQGEEFENIAVENETANELETALIEVDENSIFTKIGALFSGIWKAVKAYVNEMQVIENE